jgi:hypothetical protein
MAFLRVSALVLLGSGLLCASGLNIGNSGFEAVDISSGFGGCSGSITGSTYIYNPAGCGASWTFENGSGLTHSPSGFGNPLGPDGSPQSAFLQGPADFYQSITGVDVGGIYSISFYAFQRNCCDGSLAQTISVEFDGQLLTFSASTAVLPVTSGWTLYTTDAFVATNSVGILKFSGNYKGGDASAFVDQISSTESGVAPEPGTVGLLIGGFAAMVTCRYRTSKKSD